jgi:hypothetical protein
MSAWYCSNCKQFLPKLERGIAQYTCPNCGVPLNPKQVDAVAKSYREEYLYFGTFWIVALGAFIAWSVWGRYVDAETTALHLIITVLGGGLVGFLWWKIISLIYARNDRRR